MPYTYTENVSPRDRFEKIEIQLDNGNSAVIKKGLTYNLTAAEASRASRYAVMTFTPGAPPMRAPIVVELPVVGDPQEGEVPIWRASLGAFIPGVPTSSNLIFTDPGESIPPTSGQSEGTLWIEVLDENGNGAI